MTIAYGKQEKRGEKPHRPATTGTSQHRIGPLPHHRTGRSDHRRRNDAVRKTQPSPADRPMGRPAADYRSERTTRLSEKTGDRTIKTYYDMKKIHYYILPLLLCFALGALASLLQTDSLREWYPN